MICEKALELMSARLDGQLAPEEAAELQAHLDACPECRRVMEAMEGLDEKLSQLREPAPEGLKKGVLYRIDQASGKAKPPKRRWFGPGTAIGAVAAVLVLLVGLGVVPLRGMESAAPEAADSAAPGAADSVLPGDVLKPATEPMELEPAAPDNWAEAPAYQVPRQDSKHPDKANAPETTPDQQSPAETEIHPDDYYHSGGDGAEERNEPQPVSDALRERCAALSQGENAAVLLYTEFPADSLLELLEAEAPKLRALLAEQAADERDGLLIYETDCNTVLAIHEWLLANLPHSEMMDEAALTAEMKLSQRMEELDPGSGSLYRVVSWTPPTHPIPWPKTWPAGWALRFRTEENWVLFFPEEGYTPNAGKVAYLAFVQ